MPRKINPQFIADILTEPDIHNAVPDNRLKYMRKFADGQSTKEIGAHYGKSCSHVYIEIARGIEDRRIYAGILNTPDYVLKCHLLVLNNAMHHFHKIGAYRSCADIRRAIRNIIEILG